MDVIIIGAGIAGLTAAYELKEHVDVKILERSNRVGGRMYSTTWKGFEIDPGAEIITGADYHLRKMIEDLGLDEDLADEIGDGMTMNVLRDGKIASVDFLSVESFLKWKALSLPERLALLKLALPYLRLGDVDPYELHLVSGRDILSFEKYITERIHQSVFEYWCGPMLEVMCGYRGDDLSMLAFLAIMKAYMGSHSLTPKNGIGVIPNRIAADPRIKIKFNTNVMRVEIGKRIKLYGKIDDEPRQWQTDRLIIAIPGNQVLPLLSHHNGVPYEWVNFFDQVSYTQSASLYHIVESKFIPPQMNIVLPRNTGLPINYIGFSPINDGSGYLIRTNPSAYRFDIHDSPDKLAQNARNGIIEIFPELTGAFREHKVFKWPQKVPTFPPGMLRLLHTFKEFQKSEDRRVFFAGDYLAGPSAGAAAFTGHQAAQQILVS